MIILLQYKDFKQIKTKMMAKTKLMPQEKGNIDQAAKETPLMAETDGRKLLKILHDSHEEHKKHTYTSLLEYKAVEDTFDKIDRVFQNRHDLIKYKAKIKYNILYPDSINQNNNLSLEQTDLATINKEIKRGLEDLRTDELRESKLVRHNPNFWINIENSILNTKYAEKPMKSYIVPESQDEKTSTSIESSDFKTSGPTIETGTKSEYEGKKLSPAEKELAILEAQADIKEKGSNVIEYQKPSPSAPVEEDKSAVKETVQEDQKPWWKFW